MTNKERIDRLERHISRLLDQHDNINHLFSENLKRLAALEDRITELEQNQP